MVHDYLTVSTVVLTVENVKILVSKTVEYIKIQKKTLTIRTLNIQAFIHSVVFGFLFVYFYFYFFFAQ